MTNVTGKRYYCEVCGSEFIVTKGGEGTLHCCGRAMVQREAGKAEPSMRPLEEQEKTKEG